uniref:Odorant receptor n=1 Tax=Globodera rostochiensis TaxID=31243 RepID=A0A914GZ76_GLORO
MELFLLRHAVYERLYNCTGLDIDSIPMERRQFVPESIAICVLCAIYYLLYVPCMYSLWQHLRDNSCYKLLFYIGITDLGILWILGFYSGWANLRGAVFCSYPTLMFFMGMAVTALWVAESSADLVLAFNRCIDLVSPRFSHILFCGQRTLLWITGCSLYALFWALFIKPVVYSSIYFGWFFYPFVGYRTGDDQPETFSQVFFVSLINTLTGSLYVYIQNNEVHQWMITFAEFAWLHVHGMPPVIYLALNKTIREDCRLMFIKLFHRHRIGHIGGVTVIRPKINPLNGASPKC